MYGMQQDKGVQTYGDHLYDRVMRHESRVDIEGAATVIGEELEVARHVDDKEDDQEKAGEAHDHFLAQARGKKTGYPVHS